MCDLWDKINLLLTANSQVIFEKIIQPYKHVLYLQSSKLYIVCRYFSQFRLFKTGNQMQALP